MKRYVLAALALLVSSCGGNGDTKVKYSISCAAVQCHDQSSSSTFSSGSDRELSCIWDCADYKGHSNVYVELDFWSYNGGCYALETEYVDSGICN